MSKKHTRKKPTRTQRALGTAMEAAGLALLAYHALRYSIKSDPTSDQGPPPPGLPEFAVAFAVAGVGRDLRRGRLLEGFLFGKRGRQRAA